MPHPTAEPVSFSIMSPVAMTKNENKIPSEEAKKLIRIVMLVAPLWATSPRILRDRTGRTQGIRLRIIPPIKAKPRMNGREI